MIMKIIRLPQLVEKTGLSPSTIWRREHEGSFPRRLQLGPRSVGWREEEIIEWIDSRPESKITTPQTTTTNYKE